MRQYPPLTMTDFLRESDRIEGIRAPISSKKFAAFDRFLNGPLTLETVCKYQATVAPRRPIRDCAGMDVRVGGHVAPAGGPRIPSALAGILTSVREDPFRYHPFKAHCDFETLHPFMDGNGRTGRAIWAWHMIKIGGNPFTLGFLHTFYYQTLANTDRA